MVDLTRSSSLKEDPLHAYSGLSLFPRTLKSLSNPLPHCLYQSDDLQHTHTFLESMSFTTQEEHQEQAKAIIDNSSELLEQGCQGTAASVASEDMNVVGKMNPVPNKRERRPGLDRKRVHFCFKPTISQPPSNEPSFDGSKYPKPEDYFAAYERNKIAKREWQKQTGSSVTDAHQNLPSRRPRRQGIPGRKRGIYKHTYTDIYFSDAINLGTSEKENPIPSEQSLERTTTAHFSTADRDVDDLTVDTDKDLENILSELLACNKDELNGDDAVKLLEEHLQIKPIVVEKFTIPEFQDVKEMRLKASGRSPSNRKSVLSDIQNMLKGIHRDEVQKNRQSPTPVTNKDTSSSNPPLDQFSFPDSNHLLPGDQQSSEVASRFNSSFQKSSNEDDSHSHSGSHRSQSTTQDMNADNCVDNSITNRNSATPEVNDMQTKGNEGHVPMSETEANRNAGKRENDADINEETGQLDSLAKCASIEVARMDPLTVEEDSILYQQDVCSKSPNRTAEQCNTVDGSFEHAEYIQEKYGEVNDSIGTSCGLQVENVQEVHNSSHEQTNKRRKRGSCESNMRKRSKTVRGESEGDLIKTLSHESGAKKQIKRKSNEREEKKQMKTVTREGKIFSRRKSLAGAGTKWESGVRRSTRIKSRPLEYWRGERFLVGRIHESLATVIGIKYASPENGKTNNRTSKVKSYVSDEYKELVELAALH